MEIRVVPDNDVHYYLGTLYSTDRVPIVTQVYYFYIAYSVHLACPTGKQCTYHSVSLEG